MCWIIITLCCTPSLNMGDVGNNDGCYLNDGIRLTRPAVKKLAHNKLTLKATNKVEGAWGVCYL